MTVIDVPPSKPVGPHRRARRFRWLWWLTPVLAFGLFCMLLVPTLCRAREPAQRIKCASNLRQIGLALKPYADGNNGVLPPDWRTLAATADLTADVFICPSSDHTDRAPGRTPAEWAAALDDPGRRYNCYVYAAANLTLSGLTPEDVLAFEPADDHADHGLNVLYGDGHVDWTGGTHDPAKRPAYDRLLADHAAGVRPLRWRP